MKKIILILLLFTSVSWAKGSSLYKDLEFIAMENFSVSKDKENINIGFDYIINNPNWFGVHIKPSNLELTIADTDCGEVSIPKKIKIKRKSNGKGYAFLLIGDLTKFSKSGFSSIWSMMSKGKIDFNLKGILKAGVLGITKKWQLNYTYEMTWSEFMSFFN